MKQINILPWWQICTLLAFSQPASPGVLFQQSWSSSHICRALVGCFSFTPWSNSSQTLSLWLRNRPIYILPCLSKVLEKRNNQLTDFIYVDSILSGMQSGFRSGYGCVTATFKVLNDVTTVLDSKQCCADIFIDLAKAFDMVNHSILVGRITSIGVSEGSLTWFANYFSQRVQCIKSEHLLSQPLLYPKARS